MITANKHVGETNINTKGQQMMITEYHNYNDVTVKFDDKNIRRNISYDKFKNGNVHKKSREERKQEHVGETVIATNGDIVTIIAYHQSNNIDVRFPDGKIRRHLDYANLKKGHIRHPDNITGINHRIGETTINSSGYRMTISAYRNNADMDILFDDQTMVKNVSYTNFKRGHIKKPDSPNANNKKNERVGQQSIHHQSGKIMTLHKYNNARDIIVKFEGDETEYKTTYRNFIKGTVKQHNRIETRKNRIGEKHMTKEGFEITITDYVNSKNITVTYADGTVRDKLTYEVIKAGSVQKIKRQNNGCLDNRIGLKNTMKNGMVATITDYRSSNDIDIVFEDGAPLQNTTFRHFIENKIAYIKQWKTLKIKKLAYHTYDRWAFYIKCEKCGLSDVMTFDQMQKHKC